VPPQEHDATRLLIAWTGEGDEKALDKLVPLVQAELHRLAQRYLSKERPDHVLQSTALVHEVYIRLIDWKGARWQNRAHFFGVCAQLMRHILVDFARQRPKAQGQEVQHVTLGNALDVSGNKETDLLAVDDALKSLEALDPRKGRIVELRFFGGLTVEETAEVLKIAPITVMREWEKAKAWLYVELNRP
jgi:RNA polymerase sigma factor (TIGR02999 family)